MFLTTPRWFGYPTQQYIQRRDALESLISSVNGHGPCFVSEYVYPSPHGCTFDRVFNDFDDKESLRGPYHSCTKLLEFNERLNNPVVILFSGNKGYHLHMSVAASKMTTIELWALHNSMYRELGLTYADKHCFGVLRQIVRVPTTLHVDRFGNKNGRYCRALTIREFKQGILHTIKLSKDPGEMPILEKSSLSFKELTSHLKYYEEELAYAKKCTAVNVLISQTRATISSVNVVAPSCLNVGIQEVNPTHLTRFETTCWLKFIGYSPEAIRAFYRSLAWRDHNEEVTYYQIQRIRGRLPLCPKLEAVTGKRYCGGCPLQKEEVNGG